MKMMDMKINDLLAISVFFMINRMKKHSGKRFKEITKRLREEGKKRKEKKEQRKEMDARG